MSSVEVTRTFLHMTAPQQLRGATAPSAGVRIERAMECPPSFYRFLYREVGRDHRWVDRLTWSDARLREHLADGSVAVWVMYCRGAPAGFFEFRRYDDDSVEIAYFGLLPEFIGRGLGKVLLTAAVEHAWNPGVRRVWLHTCTLDHRSAMPNYLRRGFVPYKEERYLVDRDVAPAEARD
jgi:GNAT superfamily N-acetyltransferase